MKGLVVGPFVGEFGWELMCWQAYARRVAKDYDIVVVGCRRGHEHLYLDFADTVVYREGGKDTDSEQCNDYTYDNWHQKYTGYDWLNPFVRRSQMYHENYFIVGQDFIPLQPKGVSRSVVCIHARDTDKNGTGYRNWSKDNWGEVVSYLLGRHIPVFSIGSKGAASHIEGTVDARKSTIEDTCSLLGKSRLLIGPSSGTMHLGSLCETPHLVWSGHNRPNDTPSGNDIRYQRIWNPFSTPTIHIPFSQCSDWNPPSQLVLRYTEHML